MQLAEKAIVCVPWVTAKSQEEHMVTDPAMARMKHLRNMGFEPDEGFLQEGLQRLT